MNNNLELVYFLLGTLQVIGIGLTAWLLLTVVKVLERINKMEGKLDNFPIAQVANNRHRLENAERKLGEHELRIGAVEKSCLKYHG